MSAAFKLAKKKQQDLRRIMQEQKSSRETKEIRIDSPFAKYDIDNNLSCIICKKNVKSSVWKVHINAKIHKENVASAKKMQEKLENHVRATQPVPSLPTIQQRVALMKEEKKLKGILKNSTSASAPQPEATTEPGEPPSTSRATVIPDDFFDSKMKPPAPRLNGTAKSNKTNEEKTQAEDSSAVPEGFFDDPMKDAKARNIEYKNPVEEEWDKFRKEIKEAEAQSMTIINEEQEESTVERQIDEIDAQMRNWSR